MIPDVPRHCNRCGYAVHHQTRGTCPECGTFHDRAQPQTWSRQAVPAACRRRNALLRATAWTAAAYLLVLLVATGSNQYAIAQLIVDTERTDDPFCRWLTTNLRYFNPFRQPELFFGSVLSGAILAFRRFSYSSLGTPTV